MPFIKLQFKPGVNRDQTSYSGEGGWYECDKIRFFSGYPQKLGGWAKYTVETLIGTCRQMFNWVTTFGDNIMAYGTNAKFYLEVGGNLYDITPLRYTSDAGDVLFYATNGSSTITVIDVDNGALAGDYVTFVDAESLGGNITASVLNQNYQIASIIDADTYTIIAKDTNGDEVTANASDSGNGGASTYGQYEIHVGYEINTYGYGWGTSTWGRGTWGSGSNTPVELPLASWTITNFDNDLVINLKGGAIYYWARGASADPTTALETRAALLDAEVVSTSGWGSGTWSSGTWGSGSSESATGVPDLANQVLVSQNDKHLLAFGCTPYGAEAPEIDPLLIRWASQDDPLDWTPTTTNSAGDLRVSRGSYIVQALPTRQEILVWTDSTLSSLQFLGTTDVFGLQELADNISIISPRAAISANNVTYWMGKDKFYAYAGSVNTLPCTLWHEVFSNLNYDQTEQIISGTNEGFSEIWWFYPSGTSTVPNSYVIYNYLERIWYYGNLTRTAWLDTPLRQYPQAVGSGGIIYNQEQGVDDDGSAMTSYILSSDFDIQDGEQLMLTRRMLPDVNFSGSAATNPTPTAYITLSPKLFPGSTPGSEPNLNVIETSANIYTDQVFIRARGRTMAFKIGSTDLGVQWQLGSPRLDARPDGKR